VCVSFLGHGNAPQDSVYAYVLLVQGGLDGTAEFAQKVQDDESPVVIQQRDRDAHVVTDGASGVTAYTVFEPDTALIGRSLVRRANRQVLVMTRRARHGRDLAFSITDPDVHLYRGRDEEQYSDGEYVGDESPYTRWWQHNESIPMQTTVVLRGRWHVADAGDAEDLAVEFLGRGETAVTVTTQHGA